MRSVLIRPSVLLGIDGISAADDQPIGHGPTTWDAVEFEDAVYDLLQYDVIVVGEFHGRPACHAFQMRLLEALAARRPLMALSMEQFERDAQPAMDRYLNGQLSEEAFLRGVNEWPSYVQDYRPQVEHAKDKGLPVIAGNVYRPLASEIAKGGMAAIEAFEEHEKAWIAEEIMLDTPSYRARFYAVMAPMFQGSHAPKIEGTEEIDQAKVDAALANYFAAQACKDDTMAESMARYLEANPRHLVLHYCGAFHSAGRLGTVERLQARMPGLKIAVITPIQSDHPLSPAITLEDLREGDYLLMVPPEPPKEPAPAMGEGSGESKSPRS